MISDNRIQSHKDRYFDHTLLNVSMDGHDKSSYTERGKLE